MLELVSQATASIKALSDLGKAFVDVRDHAKLQALQIEFNNEILRLQGIIHDANSLNIELTENSRLQQEEIAELNSQIAVLDEYQLTQFAVGLFCYIQKGCSEPIKTKRKLCADCFDKGVKSTLDQRNGGRRASEPLAGRHGNRIVFQKNGKFTLSCSNCRFKTPEFDYLIPNGEQ